MYLAGFGACAMVFFAFLYQGHGWINRLEASAEQRVSNLPPGDARHRDVWAPPGSRIPFVGSCGGACVYWHCFSFANYEAASEFRVRARREVRWSLVHGRCGRHGDRGIRSG